MSKYLIVVNNTTLLEYGRYYFEKYPRRNKFPIKSPIIPSLNSWMQLHHQKQNTLKQAWKEFIIWVVNTYNMQNLNIEYAKITYTYYFHRNIRHDADNYSSKFCNDGLVESGVIQDDDFGHITVSYLGKYDKHNPRMEILIEPVNSFDELFDKTK